MSDIGRNNNKIESTETEQEINKENSNKETPKKIEVIKGNGNLTISPVYEHLEVEKPKPKENRKIFIPEVKGNPPTPQIECGQESNNHDENNDESNNVSNDEEKE